MGAKVLGLAGSPRRHGNTERLLDAALEGAAQKGATVDKVVLDTLNIGPCNGCAYCSRTGQCVLRDDMDVLYAKLRAADVVVLASPIYFRGVTAQTKAMIDRCLLLWTLLYDLKRPWREKGDRPRGLFISAAGDKGPIEFRGALLESRIFFRALDARWQPPVLLGGVNSKSDLLNEHPDALQEAREAGARLVP